MQIEGSTGHYRDLDVQALAITIFKDEKPDEGFLKELDGLTGGVVKSALDSEELSGKEGETAYFHLLGEKGTKANRLLLVGVGNKDDYRAAQITQMGGTAVRALRSKGVKSVAIVPRAEGDAESLTATVVQGAVMGLFEPDKYRTVDKEKRRVDRLIVALTGADQLSARAIADGRQGRSRRLSDGTRTARAPVRRGARGDARRTARAQCAASRQRAAAQMGGLLARARGAARGTRNAPRDALCARLAWRRTDRGARSRRARRAAWRRRGRRIGVVVWPLTSRPSRWR